MTSRVQARVVAVAVLVLLAGMTWWLTRPDPAASLAPIAARASDRTHELDEPLQRPAHVGPAELDRPAAAQATVAPGPCVVRGRVTDDDQLPVVGVRVSVYAGLEDDDREVSADTVSDAHGFYSVELPAPAWLDWVEAGPGPETTPFAESRDADLSPGGDVVVDLRVGAGLVLTGAVVDTSGAALSGARVRAWLMGDGYPDEDVALGAPHREAITDGAGRFSLPAVGPAFVVDATWRDGVSRMLLLGKGRRGQRDLHDPFVIVPARAIDVRCRDQEGEAVSVDLGAGPSAMLMHTDTLTGHQDITWGLRRLRTRTDAEGLARIAPVTDEPWDLSIEDERYPSWTGEHAPGDPPLEIMLGLGETAHGVVVDQTDAPVPGALVLFHNDRDPVVTQTSVDGSFHAAGLDGGALSWVVLAEGYALDTGWSRRDELPLRIVLAPAAPVDLRVLGEADRPLEGAIAMPERQSYRWPVVRQQLPRAQSSDAEGRLRVPWLPAGEHRIMVKAGRLQTSFLARSDAGEQVVRLVAESRVTLSGRVRDGRTGADIPEFRITRWSWTSSSSRSGRTRDFSDGRWEWTLDDVPCELHVMAEGWSTVALEIASPAAMAGPIDVELFPTRTLEVLVRDARARPVQAVLRARDADGEPVGITNGISVDTSAFIQNGRLLVAGLPARLLEVEVENRALGSTASTWIDLATAPQDPLEFVLEAGAIRPVRVMVYESAGELAGSAHHRSPWELMEQHPGALQGWKGTVSVTVMRSGAARDDVVSRHDFPADGVEHERITTWQDARFLELDVPAEPLVLRVAVPGRPAVEIAWTPATDTLDYWLEPWVVVIPQAGG